MDRSHRRLRGWIVFCVGLLAVASPGRGVAEPPAAEAYARHAQELRDDLDRHVVSMWFPRAVDPAGRGFVQNFDDDWTPRDDGVRSLVYQSRLTWLAARASQALPQRAEELVEHSNRGLRFLRDVLWDAERGGFFWAVGPDDRPTTERGDEKHVYGIAFGIYAASTNYAVTRNPEALALARDAFDWLEAHAHDAEHGGYHEALAADGTPRVELVLRPATALGSETLTDAIGTRYGLKSMNSHIHLLEAFTALYAAQPDEAVRRRLEEVYAIVRDRIVVPEVGCQNMFFTRAWQAIPGHDSFGHDVETGFLLLEAAEVLGLHDDARTHAAARRLIDHALDFGWDREHGGFLGDGPVFGPAEPTDKTWWVQAEGLNALLLMHRLHGGETRRYWDAFERQWAFIRDHQVDARHGGWRKRVAADGSPIPGLVKSDAWTEGYHQGRALMHAAAWLGEMAQGTPTARHGR